MLIITGINCADFLGRRKILRLYWLTPPICMVETGNQPHRLVALNKKGEDIRACPHPAITIFYCAFRRLSYYHFLRRTVSVSYNVDAFLRSVQFYTVDGIYTLNLFLKYILDCACYIRCHIISCFGYSKNGRPAVRVCLKRY